MRERHRDEGKAEGFRERRGVRERQRERQRDGVKAEG